MSDHPLRNVTAREAATAYLNGQITHFDLYGAQVQITNIDLRPDAIIFHSTPQMRTCKPSDLILVRTTTTTIEPTKPTKLNSDEIKTWGTIFRTTPHVLLAHHKPVETATDLFDHVAYMSSRATDYIREAETLRKEIAREQADLDAVGRVLARILPKPKAGQQ